MIVKLFLVLSMLTAQPFTSSENITTLPKPENKSLQTDFPQEGTWVQIPKGTQVITFYVEADNTETILFWLIPTGTQTWTERELIGYDIRENPTDNKFSLTWTIDKRYLHDHLYIQAISDAFVEQESINLSMEP